MEKRISQVVIECILDLGITVVYASFAGLLIVAIVASDDGPISVWRAALYASLLPAGIVVLVGIDIGLRVLAERRKARARLREMSQPFVMPPRKTCLSDR